PMNQTRVFLILAWLMVAVLLWMEWSKERAAPPALAPAPTTAVSQEGAVPQPGTALPADGSVPAASAAPPPAAAVAAPTRSAQRVTVTSDVLRLVLDGGSVVQADLPGYPRAREGDDTPVRLFDADPAHFYAAQSGWVSATGPAPTHLSGFVPAGDGREFTLAEGADSVEVPFVWQGDNGVQIRRTYILSRGDYAVGVRDEVVNAGPAPWQGQVYRQLVRKPPVIKRGYTGPES